MAATGVKFQVGNLLGEYKDSPRSVMTLDSTGDLVLLASKHVLNIVNISHPIGPNGPNCIKYPNKNVKWEVKAAQWNPHRSESSVFVVTKNQLADVFVHVNGKVELTSVLESHTRSITDLDWSPHDPNLLQTCSSDGNVLLWDTRQKSPAQFFETWQSCSSSQVKWNKLEEHVFATSHDRDIRIWDTRKTERPIYISGHLKKIHGLDWSMHNSKLLASASEDESVKFWDYSKSTQYNNIGELKSSTNSPIWKARFAPFENSLLTIDISTLKSKGDNSLMLWNIENLSSPELKFTFVGHSDVVTEFQWRKSAAENQYQLVTWSRDNTLRLCRYESETSSSPKVIDVMDAKSRQMSASHSDKQSAESPGRQRDTQLDRRPVETKTQLFQDDGDEEVDEEESSGDEFAIPNRSPGRPKRDKQKFKRLDLFPLPTLLESSMSGLDSEDEDESLLTSPNGSGDTLHNELRSLSSIRDVTVHIELTERKCYVLITNKGDHRIVLIISFPDNYPDGVAPTFRFEPNTTIDKSLQANIVSELEEAARPLISNNKACVEQCIYTLRNAIEDLESRNILETEASRYQANNAALAMSISHKNIPYPRTCGATFCTDKLVTFQRPVHCAVQCTPRSLNESLSPHTPYSSKTRTNFYVPQMSRSPKESILSSYYKRSRNKKKEKEKSGPIFIYNVASLLPVNKQLAIEYKITPSAASCRHNAEVAERQGRRDLNQIWKILEEFMDDRLAADPNDMNSGIPWATQPFGRPMIQSIMQHYAAIGDIQTLSMIVSMFPYDTPQPPPDRPFLQIGLQRSSSSIKMGTSPASSISGRSPPDRSFLLIDTESNGWNTPRRRADSHNELLERNVSIPVPHHEADLEKHKSAIQILDPEQAYLYDFYKMTYADLLYRWGMLDERAILVKTMPPESDQQTSTVAIRCGNCKEKHGRSWCQNCSKNHMPALECAMCRARVKGPATICISCHHGGHLQHMRIWFQIENECPTGCGCLCLQYSAAE